MHDLDRTVFEAGSAEYESEYESQSEGLEALFETETEGAVGELSEAQEVALASELLEVSSEDELEQFLGNLLSTAAGAARSFIASPTGQQLTGILKQTARKALPVLGRAAGEWVRPGGGAAGARLAQNIGSLFGLELEGLSSEDREYEVARAFVRFATDAGRRAVTNPYRASPRSVVRSAVTDAAHRHAPGLIGAPRRRHNAGRWVRRANSIVIYDV